MKYHLNAERNEISGIVYFTLSVFDYHFKSDDPIRKLILLFLNFIKLYMNLQPLHVARIIRQFQIYDHT